MKVQAVAIYFGVDFKKGHNGLLSLIQDQDLSERDLVLFVNKSLTGLKIMIGSQTMVYHKSARLTISEIRNIPELLGGSKMTFKKDVLEQIVGVFEQKLRAVS